MRVPMTLLALLVAAPLSAQHADTIPVAWPVAEGGVVYEVQVGDSAWSQHSTIHGALREASMVLADCWPECASVQVVHSQTYRIDTRVVVRFREDEPEPEPEPEPDPEPEVWRVDSVTVYPDSVEMEVGQEGQLAGFAWRDDVAHICATVAAESGFLEAFVELDDPMDWIVVPADPAWWPGACPTEASQVAFDLLPTEQTQAFQVGVYPDEEPGAEDATEEDPDAADLPAPGQPTFEATEDGALVSWEPSEGADGYRVAWRGEDLTTAETNVEVTGMEVGDWVCVWPRLGENEGDDQRCNTWREE